MNTEIEKRFHMPTLTIVINYLIASLILFLSAYILYTEILKRSKSDLFVDITLAVMVIGISFYNLIDNHFDFKVVITYLYILTIIIVIINIVFFSLRHIKKI